MTKKTLSPILSFLETGALGGAERNLIAMLVLAAKDGHPIYLASNNQDVKQYLLEQTALHQVTITFFWMPFRIDVIGDWKGLLKFPVTVPRAYWWLHNILEQIPADRPLIAFLLGFTDRLVFTPFLKSRARRIIWLEQSILEPVFSKHFRIPQLLYQLSLPAATHLTALSQHVQHSMSKHTGREVRVLYPGIEIPSDSRLQHLKKGGIEWRKKMKLVNLPILLVMGRVAHEKQFELAIQAVAHLHRRNKYKDTHLVIVGDGPAKKELENLVVEQDLKKYCHFMGTVTDEERDSILAAAEIFLFPSAWVLEGFGLTTAEAMAAGKAIVTSGAGPQAELISDTENGLTFLPNDAADLAIKCQLLLRDPKLAHKLGRAARKTVQQRFSKAQLHVQLRDLFS
ncbi:MAG: glycosyltransferase family 4 protein [bacterium]|nr:glycosyltransferase family 4 protein [bacterium]